GRYADEPATFDEVAGPTHLTGIGLDQRIRRRVVVLERLGDLFPTLAAVDLPRQLAERRLRLELQLIAVDKEFIHGVAQAMDESDLLLEGIAPQCKVTVGVGYHLVLEPARVVRERLLGRAQRILPP